MVFLASGEPYSRTARAMMNTSLKIGNVGRRTPKNRFSGAPRAVAPRFSRALDGHRVSSADILMHERRRIRLNQPQNGAAPLVCFTRAASKNAYAIRQIAKRGSYRLEKKGDDRYRLINARFNRRLST
jgi:hypothetical protein